MKGFQFEQVENRDLLTAGVGLDFIALPQDPQALLLPAVQKIREAAVRMDVQWNLTSNPPKDAVLIGLLLPAIQK